MPDDFVEITAGSGTPVATEALTSLNGNPVSPTRHAQRCGIVFITGDATAVDAPGDEVNGAWVNVKASALPTDAATQTTLSSIDGKISACDTTAVVISSGTVGITGGVDVSGSLVDVTGSTVAITGSVGVTGTFWQATQPVSGTFWQATQPVSGTFWQATQPVSIASLPSLAAGSAVIGHVIVDSGTITSITNSVAVTGTFWQATQPVSGTFWQATQPVSLASVPTNQSRSELQVTWSSANSLSIGSASNGTSDGMTLASDCTQAQIHCKADNDGTASSGDTIDVYMLPTGGDPDGTGSDEYASTGQGIWLCNLDVSTSGKDPAQTSVPINPACKGFKIYGVNNSAGRAITLSACVTQISG